MTICLSMIVKNEADVIVRCLKSVMPVIDTWCIVDTGSTDGTQDLIKATFLDLKPGYLIERPWVDFAHNRSEALALARPMADYSFIIDADDILAEWAQVPLTADSYSVLFRYQGITYPRVQLVSNKLPWRYRGVLHEFLECSDAGPGDGVPWVIQVGSGGARGKDPETYRKDALILEKAFSEEKESFLKARYGFYLAQSWRDCGEKHHALVSYEWRAAQGLWSEEVYVSLLNAGRIAEEIKPDEALGFYQQAIRVNMSRAEAYHGAARLCRTRKQFADGLLYAQEGVRHTSLPPGNGLFVEPWIYEWALIDELAINAYWAGHYRLSLDASELILAEGKCPHVDRVKTNAAFARRALIVAKP